ncbi:hypothetical protein DFH11DRAFT_205233 [Phellopilus nigrolimitatus]|nr:hypothetical protein DFH11DRAFT_205233 [Phellopilus nigrolimitatus]
MGCSAKLHKRVKKTASSVSQVPNAIMHAPKASTSASVNVKRRTGLKDKAAGVSVKRAQSDGPVLGGADYVEMMMGSRRKAREEARKLPPPN